MSELNKKNLLIQRILIGVLVVFSAIYAFFSVLVAEGRPFTWPFYFGGLMVTLLIFIGIFYLGRLGPVKDQKKNEKKIWRGFVISFVILLLAIFGQLARIGKTRVENNEVLKDMNESVTTFVDKVIAGEEVVIDSSNKTEEGQFIDEMFTKIGNYIYEYSSSIENIEIHVPVKMEQYEDVEYLKMYVEDLNSLYEMDKKYFEGYPSLLEEIIEEGKERGEDSKEIKAFISGVEDQYLLQGTRAEKKFELLQEFYDSEIEFIEFMIENNDEFIVVDDEIYFYEDYFVDAYNILIERTLVAEQKLNEMQTEMMEDFTKLANTLAEYK